MGTAVGNKGNKGSWEVLIFREGATREKRGFDFSETRNYEYIVLHLIRKNDFLL